MFRPQERKQEMPEPVLQNTAALQIISSVGSLYAQCYNSQGLDSADSA